MSTSTPPLTLTQQAQVANSTLATAVLFGLSHVLGENGNGELSPTIVAELQSLHERITSGVARIVAADPVLAQAVHGPDLETTNHLACLYARDLVARLLP